MQLRVFSYNIHKGKGPLIGSVRLHDLIAEVAGRKADLVLCQEVFHGMRAGPWDQSRDLAAGLDLVALYEPNAVYSKGHHGNTTLTRLDVGAVANHNLSTNPLEKRGVLYSSHPIGGHQLHVFNTHLGLNNRQRRHQAGRICQIIEEKCGDGGPILLAGDFNDWTGGLGELLRARAGLQNAFAGLVRERRVSWPSNRPFFDLDRIYFRGLHLVEARVHQAAPWTRLSDHLPVEAEFALE